MLARRTPPVVAGVAGVASSVRHGKDHARTHRTSDLDSLLNLFFGGTQLLRTCEVRDRSRLAMKRQNKR